MSKIKKVMSQPEKAVEYSEFVKKTYRNNEEFSYCPVCGGREMYRDEADLNYKYEVGYEVWVCENDSCGKAFTIHFDVKFTSLEIE